MCGGTALFGPDIVDVDGLSPRVRGNPAMLYRYQWFLGSIPACAGEPATTGGWTRSCKVYPRVCGGTGQFPRRRGG